MAGGTYAGFSGGHWLYTSTCTCEGNAVCVPPPRVPSHPAHGAAVRSCHIQQANPPAVSEVSAPILCSAACKLVLRWYV